MSSLYAGIHDHIGNIICIGDAVLFRIPDTDEVECGIIGDILSDYTVAIASADKSRYDRAFGIEISADCVELLQSVNVIDVSNKSELAARIEFLTRTFSIFGEQLLCGEIDESLVSSIRDNIAHTIDQLVAYACQVEVECATQNISLKLQDEADCDLW